MEVGLIIDFFKMYGWQLGLLAFSGIVLLGFLKKVGVFNKLKKEYRKYVFFGISAVLSIIACTAYLLIINKFEWVSYLVLCAMVFAVTYFGYGIYEHTEARWLWNKFIDLIVAGVKKLFCLIFVHKVNADKLTKEITKFGVDEAVKLAQELQNKVNEEKKKAEQEKQNTTPTISV